MVWEAVGRGARELMKSPLVHTWDFQSPSGLLKRNERV